MVTHKKKNHTQPQHALLKINSLSAAGRPGSSKAVNCILIWLEGQTAHITTRQMLPPSTEGYAAGLNRSL